MAQVRVLSSIAWGYSSMGEQCVVCAKVAGSTPVSPAKWGIRISDIILHCLCRERGSTPLYLANFIKPDSYSGNYKRL